MNSPSAVRAKIYAFLHQKFGIERVKHETELQELKKLLVELQESTNPQERIIKKVEFPLKKDGSIEWKGRKETQPAIEAKFYAPKTF